MSIPEYEEPSGDEFLSDGDSYLTRNYLIVWSEDEARWLETPIPT